MIEFTDCDVIINGTGLVAESASISESNSVSPAYGAGYSRPAMLPDGPKTTQIQINYKINPNSEPNFGILSDLKANPPILNPINIEIAGLRCSGYMTDWSFTISANETSDASVSYISYNDIVGDVNKKRGTIDYDLDVVNYGHGWTAVVNYENSDFVTSYDFSYSCSFEYVPCYGFGATMPNQVVFVGGEESARITKESFDKMSFYGNSGAYEVFSKLQSSVSLYNLSREVNADTLTPLNIDLRDATASNSNLSARLDDYVKTEITFERAF